MLVSDPCINGVGGNYLLDWERDRGVCARRCFVLRATLRQRTMYLVLKMSSLMLSIQIKKGGRTCGILGECISGIRVVSRTLLGVFKEKDAEYYGRKDH